MKKNLWNNLFWDVGISVYWNSKKNSVRGAPALLSWASACMNLEDWGANSAKESNQVTLGHPQNSLMFWNIPGGMENAILSVELSISVYEEGRL